MSSTGIRNQFQSILPSFVEVAGVTEIVFGVLVIYWLKSRLKVKFLEQGTKVSLGDMLLGFSLGLEPAPLPPLMVVSEAGWSPVLSGSMSSASGYLRLRFGVGILTLFEAQ